MVAVPYQDVSLALDEELPDDLDDSGRYIEVPHKNDLDLGKDLVFRFAGQHMQGSYEHVRSLFQRKGAYRRFRQFLESKGLLAKWHRFEEQATEAALREWCAQNEIELVDKT